MTKKKLSFICLDVHIKIFLSCCHRFCQEYYDPSVTEFWFSKADFLSLLNLPGQIEKYGPLGLYWDGVFEHFIQRPKKALKTARKTTSSLLKKMTVLQKWSHMDYIRDGLTQGTANNQKGKRYQEGVRIYPTKDEILRRLDDGRAISGFINNRRQNEIFVPYNIGKRDEYTVLILKYTVGVDDTNGCGLNYAKFEVVETQNPTPFSKCTLEIGGAIADHYCLMLPQQGSTVSGFNMYSIITNDWLVFIADGNISEPNLCTKMFN